MGLGEKPRVAEECIQQDFMFILSRDLYLINHRKQQNKIWTRIILTIVQKNIIQEKICIEFETERGDSNKHQIALLI